MRRRLLNVLTALSLLLCVAVVVQWRRDWSPPHMSWEPPGWRARLTVWQPVAAPGDTVVMALEDLEGPGLVTRLSETVADDGTVELPYYGLFAVAGMTGSRIELEVEREYRMTQFIPRRWARVSVSGGDWHVPYAVLVAVLAPLPAVRALSWLRTLHRHPPGHCRRCGYDLRATPGRCPECGTEPVRTPA